ncbi:MAG: HAD family phosphatase [Bacteroidota bacterium]
MAYTHIKNLLIDLGDVLYHIDFDKMVRAFAALQDPEADPVHFSKKNQHDVFSQLEVGKISQQAFINEVRGIYHLKGTDQQIIDAWNAILVALIPERIDQLKALKSKYKLALLSNTNIIHQHAFQEECADLLAQFDKIYLSHEFGRRKPDADTFLTILDEMGWRAEETLFLDDSPPNIKAAEALGIAVCFIETPEVFDALMPQLLP